MDDETDTGPAASRRAPERFCIVTRESSATDDLIRFVVAPDGNVVPDLSRKLPGRGAWVTATRDMLEKAVKQKAFVRAFRGEGKAAADLVTLTDGLIERAALDAISLANKAGRIVAGNAKVEAALGSGNTLALFHAADGSRDGKRKLDQLARRIEAEGGGKIERLTLFSGTQLDLALGRSNVVHAALLASPASRGFLDRCLRLDRWRNGISVRPTAAPDPMPQDLSSLEHE